MNTGPRAPQGDRDASPPGPSADPPYEFECLSCKAPIYRSACTGGMIRESESPSLEPSGSRMQIGSAGVKNPMADIASPSPAVLNVPRARPAAPVLTAVNAVQEKPSGNVASADDTKAKADAKDGAYERPQPNGIPPPEPPRPTRPPPSPPRNENRKKGSEPGLGLRGCEDESAHASEEDEVPDTAEWSNTQMNLGEIIDKYDKCQ